MSWGDIVREDIVRGDYVLRELCPGFKRHTELTLLGERLHLDGTD